MREAEKNQIEDMRRHAQKMADDAAWVNFILTHYPLDELVPLLKKYLKEKAIECNSHKNEH